MKQPHAAPSTTPFAPGYHFALALAFFAFACIPFGEAAASDPARLPDSDSALQYKKHLGQQLTHVLRSDIQEVREDALVTLISLIQREGYDLRSTTPALLDLYQNPRHPKERKMAATALCLLGDEPSIEALILFSDADSDRAVQRHARRRIAAYYLHTYPELVDSIDKKGQLRHRHIQRAKRKQARASAGGIAANQ